MAGWKPAATKALDQFVVRASRLHRTLPRRRDASTTMAKGILEEKTWANCGGGRPARHWVVQNIISLFVGPKGPGRLKMTHTLSP